jgi:hypothetical protein
MSDPSTALASLPYLSQPFLDGLSITTAEVLDSIEELILAQRRGQVWCAPSPPVSSA